MFMIYMIYIYTHTHTHTHTFICGLLLVQEPVQRRRGGGDAGEEGEGGSRWNLKWCELSGMELKMYV